MARQKVLPVHEGNGYASRFERRPEFLFGYVIPSVIDARVRERAVQELRVFKIDHVFTGMDEIFLGFGKPNTYLTVPDGKGGYQKFAGKSLRRAPSTIEDTRGWVQSGILVRFKNLPPHAAERLRAAMERHNGKKYWTCVNANLRVMEDAGFAAGDKKLSRIYFPYQLMRALLNNALTFEGKPVECEVIRTTPLSVERYTRSIIWAEVTTFWRHFKKTRVGGVVSTVLSWPGRLFAKLFGSKTQSAPPPVTVEVAPALPSDVPYHEDLLVRASQASVTGRIFRRIWGPHALFEAQQSRVNVDQYLKRALTPFPQKRPGWLTRLKKRVLFSRPVIWMIRRLLAPRFVEIGIHDERDIYDMLRTHSDSAPNIYNMVITRKPPEVPGGNPITRMILARITVGSKIVDWILSKHVLMSGYLATETGAEEYPVWAGESWKTPQGRLKMRGNSGTYRPEDEDTNGAVAFTQEVFPHLPVEKEEMTALEK